MKNVEVVSKEKNIFGMAKKEYQKKPTGKLIIDEEDFKELTSAARDNEHFKSQIKAFLGTDLMQENMKLGREIKNLSSRLVESRKENKKLVAENNDLKFDIRGFKDRIEALTIEVHSAYKGVKEFVKEHARDARGFKNAFIDVVDRIKSKSRSERERSGFESPVGEFERIHKKETNRERNRGMERF